LLYKQYYLKTGLNTLNMDSQKTKIDISPEIPDWSREAKPFFSWQPSRSLLASIRSYQSHSGSRHPWRIFLRKIAVLRHWFWSIVTGADIPINCQLGGGLLLPHPNGIVIHPGAKIGPNCLVFQQVTIGSRNGDGLPVIGGHVDIGAGAKILGAIKIGNHACIGANAVVIKDVQTGKTAVGIPAKIV
jgi:serine O-acetyltransferase